MAGTGTGTPTPEIITATSVTAEQVIKRSLRLLGVLATGESPSADESADCLESFQLMLDSWSADSSVNQVPNEFTHTLVAGTADYTVGPTGDVVRNRPTEIFNMFLRQGSVDYPVDEMTRDEYYGTVVKDLAIRPTRYLFEQLYDDVRIRFESAPDFAYTMFAYALDPFTAPTTLTSDMKMPPGYQEAYVYNLAVRLAPEFQVQTRIEIVARADDLERGIQARYSRTPEMRTGLRSGRYDINSDRHGRGWG